MDRNDSWMLSIGRTRSAGRDEANLEITATTQSSTHDCPSACHDQASFLFVLNPGSKRADGTSIGQTQQSLESCEAHTTSGDGYLSKSGFLEQRLVGCHGIEKVQSFWRPRHYLASQNAPGDEWAGIFQILNHAIGGILLDSSKHACAISGLCRIEAELDNRLSFLWTTPQPIMRKRLAFVDCRERGFTEPILRFAKALSIGMIVRDKCNHYLELPEVADIKAVFVPFDMTIDKTLPLRIVEALIGRSAHLDRLTTNFALYTYLVAEAETFFVAPSRALGRIGYVPG